MTKILRAVLISIIILPFLKPFTYSVFADQNYKGIDSDQVIIDDRFIKEAKCVFLEDKSVQLSRVSKISEGKSTCGYISDTVLLTSDNPQKRVEIANAVKEVKESKAALRSGGGDHGAYEWDSSGSVKISTRVYYTTTTSNKLSYTKITKVKGGYSSENGVSVKTQSLRVGQSGKSISTGKYVEQIKTYTLNKKSWSKTPPSTWKAVCIDTSPVTIGCTYTAKLKRGTSSSTWTVELVNNLSVNSLK